MKTAQNGFTLIELLIVIVIIGVLSGLVINLLDINEFYRQARDAKRLNDILMVQTALQGALLEGSVLMRDTSVCVECNSFTGTTNVDGSGWVNLENVSGNGLKNFLQILPVDPVNTSSQNYSYYSNGKSFELNTKLEAQKNSIYEQKDGGNDDTVYERGLNLQIQ